MISNQNIFFTKEECEFIINLSKTLIKIEPFGKYDLSSNGTKNKVSYSVWSIDRNEKFQWIFDKIDGYFTYKTNLKIKKQLDKLYIHNYIKGQHFAKHTDSHYPTQIHNVGVCLNDNYAGGEFILYDPDYTLPKKQGEIYTFQSNRPHEVKKILNGERWSIIGFLHAENVEFTNRSLI